MTSDTPKNRPDSESSSAAEPVHAGLSLDKLSQAFARLLGRVESAPPAVNEPERDADPSAAEDQGVGPTVAVETIVEDEGEVSPLSILEAMLFVGNTANQPLTRESAAALMRGVDGPEIDDLVRQLNALYAEYQAPYEIAFVGDGYRLVLHEQWERLRDKFYGRIRQARLSQAAIKRLQRSFMMRPPCRADLRG